MRAFLGGHSSSRAGLGFAAFHLLALGTAGLWALIAGHRGWSGPDVYGFLGLLGGLFLLWAGAVWLTWNRRPSTAALLGWAVLFRLLLLPVGFGDPSNLQLLLADLRGDGPPASTYLLYDDDVWRYLWDGHLSASGIAPWTVTPGEIEAALDGDDPVASVLVEDPTWDEIFDRVSYRDHRTIYPPVAEALFLLAHLVAPASIVGWKLILLAVDLTVCVLLLRVLRRRGLPEGRMAVYAWSPLVIAEVAGSGHVDVVVALAVVATIAALSAGHPRGALLAWTAAVLTKLTPVLAIPVLLKATSRRSWPILGVALALGGLPVLPWLRTWLEALGAFSGEWIFNAGPWLVLRALGGGSRAVADTLALVIVLAVAGVAASRVGLGKVEGVVSGLTAVLMSWVVVSATVMPWYLVWAMPLLALRWSWGLAIFSASSCLSYLTYVDGTEHLAWLLVEFGALGLGLALDLRGLIRSVRQGGAGRAAGKNSLQPDPMEE